MNEYLSTLGLCLRAGKLTAGLEAVCDCVSQSGDVRLVLLSADAGESTVRRVRRAAEGISNRASAPGEVPEEAFSDGGSTPPASTITEPTVDTIIDCRFVIFMRETAVIPRLFIWKCTHSSTDL